VRSLSLFFGGKRIASASSSPPGKRSPAEVSRATASLDRPVGAGPREAARGASGRAGAEAGSGAGTLGRADISFGTNAGAAGATTGAGSRGGGGDLGSGAAGDSFGSSTSTGST